MMLNKILDQYLSSYHIKFKSIKGFRNYEILKTLTEKLSHFGDADGDANANTGARRRAIAFPELCSGKLKTA